MTACEACGGPILSPGHGRRFCERCSPPTALAARACGHGTVGPCVGCWLIDSRKRLMRVTGGRITGSYTDHLKQEIVAERERIKSELALLAASDLNAEQRDEVATVLRADHRQGLRDLRASLRAELRVA